jgi:hypothetical protein
MIEEDISAKLVWGIDTKYSDSNIHTFLENYLNTLKDYEVYLQENNWCNESVDVENYNCKEMINEYVGLLSTKDYLQLLSLRPWHGQPWHSTRQSSSTAPAW